MNSTRPVRRVRIIAYFLFVLMGCTAIAPAHAETTIVIIRHGEKPADGLGQLSCRGLNRSLALAPMLLSRYGIPAVIYAPNPAIKKLDKGIAYAYVRPLATIEPLAVRAGLPVNVDYGMRDIDGLQEKILSVTQGTQIVVWEHHLAVDLARRLLKALGGDPTGVPDWKDADFDSIYVIRATGGDGSRHASFRHEHEGLNDLSVSCGGGRK